MNLNRKRIRKLEKKVEALEEYSKTLEKALSKYSVFNRRGWNPIEILANEVYLNTIYINKLKGKNNELSDL